MKDKVRIYFESKIQDSEIKVEVIVGNYFLKEKDFYFIAFWVNIEVEVKRKSKNLIFLISKNFL